MAVLWEYPYLLPIPIKFLLLSKCMHSGIFIDRIILLQPEREKKRINSESEGKSKIEVSLLRLRVCTDNMTHY